MHTMSLAHENPHYNLPPSPYTPNKVDISECMRTYVMKVQANQQ